MDLRRVRQIKNAFDVAIQKTEELPPATDIKKLERKAKKSWRGQPDFKTSHKK